MKCKKWTIEEESLIKHYYPIMTCKDIQKKFLMARTINSIRHRARFLGMEQRVVHEHVWSTDEDNLIRHYYPETGPHVLHGILVDRTKDAINSRASKLKVRRQRKHTVQKFEPQLCVCGCGQYVKINSGTHRPNTYITGHNGRGKLKVSRVVCICKTCGKERLLTVNMIENGQGNFCSRKCKGKWRSLHNRGENNSFYGQHHTQETKDTIKEKNSGSNSGMWGRHQTEKQKEAVRQHMLENPPLHNNPEGVKKNKENRRKTMLLKYGVEHAMQVPEIRERMSVTLRNNPNIHGDNHWTRRLGRTKETREKTGTTFKRLWQDPVFIEKVLQGRGRRPNGPETLFISIMPDNVRYTGDGSWWRKLPNGKHKNPDFKVTGASKVIEVFGDYFHKDDNPQELINLYKQVGIDCLVIWEHELENNLEDVQHKVTAFMGNKPHEQEVLV